MSRSFIHTLVGLAITIVGYAVDVNWTFEPTFLVWDSFRIDSVYVDMTQSQKAVILLGSLTFNVVVWALISFLLVEGVKAVRRRWRRARPSP